MITINKYKQTKKKKNNPDIFSSASYNKDVESARKNLKINEFIKLHLYIKSVHDSC